MESVLPETKGDSNRNHAENDWRHQAMDQTQDREKNAKPIAPVGRLMSCFRLRHVRVDSQEFDGVPLKTAAGRESAVGFKTCF